MASLRRASVVSNHHQSHPPACHPPHPAMHTALGPLRPFPATLRLFWIFCHQHPHSHLLHMIRISVLLSMPQGKLTSVPNLHRSLPPPPQPRYLSLLCGLWSRTMDHRPQSMVWAVLPAYLCSDCRFLPWEGKGTLSLLYLGTWTPASPLSGTQYVSVEWVSAPATRAENHSQSRLTFSFPYSLLMCFPFLNSLESFASSIEASLV